MSGFSRVSFNKQAAQTLAQLAAKISDADTVVGGTFGTLAQGMAPVYSGTAWVPSDRAWACATTDVVGLSLRNTTPATSGVPVQYSPMVRVGTTVWNSTGAGASNTEDWALQVRPSSAASPASELHFLRDPNGAGYVSRMNVTSGGILTANGAVIAGVYTRTGTSLYTQGNYTSNSGLGSCDAIFCASTIPLLLQHNTAGMDTDNGVVCAVNFKKGAALTYPATLRILSVGVTPNTTPTRTELFSVRGDGASYQQSARIAGDLGGVASHVTLTNTVEASAGAATGDFLVVYNGTTKLKLALYANA